MPIESSQLGLRLAARALGRHGLAHAYGHCSLRLSSTHFLVCAAQPMGLIGAGEPGEVVPVNGPLPAGVLGEVRIHQRIYARRPDVHGITRTQPPALMALGTARRVPQPRHGFGAYFGAGIGLWDDPQLLRDDESADRLALQLGDRRAIVMRGNGLVMAAASIIEATVFTWYLEDAARLELMVEGAGLQQESVILTPDECARRAVITGQIIERMWTFLTANDPETPAVMSRGAVGSSDTQSNGSASPDPGDGNP